jgi:Icc-related predicted phosphoesterase
MKIICFADTHRCVEGLDISKADIVVCAGDFCNSGSLKDVIVFNNWFSKLPCKYKIIVAGNHDVCFETNPSLTKPLLDKGIIYLQDEEVLIEGIKFYGSPWQLPFMNWAFNLPEDELEKKFFHIPLNVDILITHSPPYGILDNTPTKTNLGSRSLLKKVLQVKPRFHIFGHIHHGYGKYTDKANNITFINASLLDEDYKFVNEPIIIEI